MGSLCGGATTSENSAEENKLLDDHSKDDATPDITDPTPIKSSKDVNNNDKIDDNENNVKTPLLSNSNDVKNNISKTEQHEKIELKDSSESPQPVEIVNLNDVLNTLKNEGKNKKRNPHPPYKWSSYYGEKSVCSCENIKQFIGTITNNEITKEELDDILVVWKGYELELVKRIKELYNSKLELPKLIKINKVYKMESILGKGNYGVVKLAKRKRDNKLFAAKMMNKTRMTSNNSSLTKDELQALYEEISILERLDHPNIVRLYDVFDSPKLIVIIMGLLSGGELLDRIIENDKKNIQFSEKVASNIFAQLMAALDFMHSNGIIHRDLKPENLMFESKSTMNLKLVDFGLATKLNIDKQTNEYIKLRGLMGTAEYIAPEMFREKPYDFSVDMWSSGCILYIIVSGNKPFDWNPSMDKRALVRSILKPNYDKLIDNNLFFKNNVSDSCKDLIKSLLNTKVRKRITAKDCLKHIWLKEAGDQILGHIRSFNLKRTQFTSKLRRGVRVLLAVQRMIDALSEKASTQKKDLIVKFNNINNNLKNLNEKVNNLNINLNKFENKQNNINKINNLNNKLSLLEQRINKFENNLDNYEIQQSIDNDILIDYQQEEEEKVEDENPQL